MSDVSHAGITVGDIERSVRFYTEVLGMDVKRRYVSNIKLAQPMWNTPGLERLDNAMVGMPKSEQEVQLTQASGDFGDRRDRVTFEPWDIGAGTVRFQVDDLQAVMTKLNSEGFGSRGKVVGGTGPIEGYQIAWVKDPDGFDVELVQPPAGADQDISRACITVSDLDRSVWYYCELLGMELVHRHASDPGRADTMWDVMGVEAVDVAALRMPGQAQQIELRQVTGLPQERLAHRQWDVGFSHVCFRVPDLVGLIDRIATLELRPPRAFLSGEGTAATFVANSHVPDPDGFDLELIQLP